MSNDLNPGGGTPAQSAAQILYRLIGAATLAAGSMLFGAGTSTLSTLPIGAANTVLTSSGTAPQWSTSLALTGTVASKQTTAAGISLDHNSATGNFTLRLSPANLATANRRWTFPDRDDTVAGLGAQTFTGAQTFSSTVTISGLTIGRILYSSTGGLLTDSSKLLWDNSAQEATLGDATGNVRLNFNQAASNTSGFAWKTAGNFRWLYYVTNAETGSDAGCDLVLGRAYTDGGVGIDNPITITRAAGGNINITRPISSAAAITLTSASNGLTISKTTGTTLTVSSTTTSTTPASNAVNILGGIAGLYFTSRTASGQVDPATGSVFDLYAATSQTGATENKTGVVSLALSGAGNTGFNHCSSFRMNISGAGNFSYAVPIRTRLDHGGSGTVSLAYQNAAQLIVSGGGVVTSWAAYRVETPSITSGSIGSAHGLWIDNITGATNNYAIRTGTGSVSFGDCLTLATGTKTTNAPAIDATQTWNAGGVTFAGWKLNVTDTASASASLLLDLQVGGSSIFSVRKDSNFTAGRLSWANSTQVLTIGDGTTASGSYCLINGPAGQERSFLIRTNGSNRWAILASTTAESGSNAGSALQFAAYADGGTSIDVPFSITRAAFGLIDLARPTKIATGTITTALPVLDCTTAWNSGGTTFTGWRLNVTDTASASSSLLLDLQVGSGTRFSVRKDGQAIHTGVTGTTAATDAILVVGNNSSGTPAAGYGSRTVWQLKSSTTNGQDAAQLETSWVVATHASRTARAVWSVYDTAARECLRMEASGSAAMIGFLGATAVARATMAAATGTATRTTFDTTTVTTQQLAERVKALIDDLRSYGLHG